jgi:nucleoside phosphorylase
LLTDFAVVVNPTYKELDHANYYEGSLDSRNGKLKVILTKSPEMGMPAATATAMKVIFHFKPRYIIMTGIAAGISGKTKVGDVLVGEVLWNSGSGKRVRDKVEKIVNSHDGAYSSIQINYVSKFVPYINQIDLDASVASEINSIIDQELYCSEIKANYDLSKLKTSAQKSLSHNISIRLGPFASGSSVIANEEIVEELKEQHAKLLGFDMEAYGVFYAAKHSLGPKPIPISIKSVSDFGDSKKNNPNKDALQIYAAYTSAAFFRKLVVNHLKFR